ncbi:MAG: TonB-dependent receptor [Hyphomonadaceae bacterium JAD_PAG50586_4]|nr:MAG: TonB-dependent receptor [Hyphomonadaceae bacterium JAD_PAG50586_4]
MTFAPTRVSRTASSQAALTSIRLLRASALIHDLDSEMVDAYELGLKTELFDSRLRANFALFRSEMEDFQVLEFTGVQFVTFNVPNVLAEGAEVELFGRLTDDLNASLAVTYTDARYPDDCAPASAPITVRSLCGSELTNAPELVSVLGFDYDRDVFGDLRFFVSGSVRYESDRRTSTQAYNVPTSGPVRQNLLANDIQDANTKVNLRLGIGGQDQRWSFEVWGTNIFAEQTRNVTFNIPLRGLDLARNRRARRVPRRTSHLRHHASGELLTLS